MQTRKFEAAVIGGGIIGSAIAYHLSSENIQTAVFEANEIGGKTTSAAAGMLGAHSEWEEFKELYPFVADSHNLYNQLSLQLKETCGIDIELKKGGILNLVYSEEEKKKFNSVLHLPSVSWLSAEEVWEIEKHVSQDIFGAVYMKDDVHVTPISACNGFSKGAYQLGAQIFEHTIVLEVERFGSEYLIKTTKGDFYAEKVIIASGVWTNKFFAKFGLENALVPVKGECLSVINDRLPLSKTLFHEKSYIVPRNNNQLVIGATQKWNDWNELPSFGGIQEIMEKARKMMPELALMRPSRFWAGLRPQSFDKRPFIGEHPETTGLYFAAGHQRNGILMAPATGMMITDLIMGRKVNELWLNAFRIDRAEHSQMERV
ncbi:glycine oxidase ThiO [Niallia sp. MER 6]|uniref:glycine oxidase ThiO n=1 Tax=Niallia sp. MER 6 TaxID=2939567 RepID=UPI00203D3C11|nr:glycine oxidase ThiO [Niallia sp. MER 6]MCM3033805.1 glycine oxidase ThiO [Niallia sp. MER 6]